MSLWNDAFEAYLAAEESDFEAAQQEFRRDTNDLAAPVMVMLFINQTSKSTSPLSQIDAQYSSLVQQFGKETVDAIRRAISGEGSDSKDSGDTGA